MNHTPRGPLSVLDPSGLSRRRFLVLGTGTLAALVTGCGGSSPTEQEGVGGFTGDDYTGPAVDLNYWNGFTGGDGPTMQALVDKFNSSYDNITVRPNTIEWADFYQKLPAAVEAEKGPEVGVMHLDQLATNAARQIIVPLDDLTEALGLSEEDFAPAVWEPGIYNEQRYGIPLDVHSLAMYWNQEHFDKAGISEPPSDAASFDEACQKLQAAGYDQPFWMPNQWPAHLMFLSLLWQFGGEPYAPDGSAATFGSEEGVQALTWMKEQIDKGYSPPNIDIDAQYVAFKNGQNSITWDGIWQINDLKSTNMNFGLAPLPAIGDEPGSWANSHNFFLTSQAAADEDLSNASKTFIGWMSEQSAAWSEAGMIPARNSAREEAAYTESLQYALREQTEHLHFLPPVPGLGDVQPSTLEVAVNETLLGQAEPADALAEQQENATQLMEENLQRYGG